MRLTWTVAFVCVASSAYASTARILGRDADKGFEELIAKSRTGGFSCSVAGGWFQHEGDEGVILELRCRDGGTRRFILGRPALARAHAEPWWFALAPGAGVTAADVTQMEKLLDDAFTFDPWVVRDLKGDQLDQLWNDSQGVGRHDIGRAGEGVLIGLLAISFILGLGYVWFARPQGKA